MINLLLNVNHRVALLSHGIGYACCGADMKNFISVCWNWFHGYHQNLSKSSVFLSSVFKAVKPA